MSLFSLIGFGINTQEHNPMLRKEKRCTWNEGSHKQTNKQRKYDCPTTTLLICLLEVSVPLWEVYSIRVIINAGVYKDTQLPYRYGSTLYAEHCSNKQKKNIPDIS